MDYLIKLIFVLSLSAGAYSQTVDRIAVIVNDGVVLESDIQLKIKNFKKEAAVSGARVPSEKDLRDEILEMGDNFWGDQIILSLIQEKLKLNVIILSNTTTKVYPTGTDINKFERTIVI